MRQIIRALWKGNWHETPVRKPLAVVSLFACLVIGAASFFSEKDILPGAVQVLSWSAATVIAGYFGTSTIEALKKEEKHGQEESGKHEA